MGALPVLASDALKLNCFKVLRISHLRQDVVADSKVVGIVGLEV